MFLSKINRRVKEIKNEYTPELDVFSCQLFVDEIKKTFKRQP